MRNLGKDVLTRFFDIFEQTGRGVDAIVSSLLRIQKATFKSCGESPPGGFSFFPFLFETKRPRSIVTYGITTGVHKTLALHMFQRLLGGLMCACPESSAGALRLLLDVDGTSRWLLNVCRDHELFVMQSVGKCGGGCIAKPSKRWT